MQKHLLFEKGEDFIEVETFNRSWLSKMFFNPVVIQNLMLLVRRYFLN